MIPRSLLPVAVVTLLSGLNPTNALQQPVAFNRRNFVNGLAGGAAAFAGVAVAGADAAWAADEDVLAAYGKSKNQIAKDMASRVGSDLDARQDETAASLL